MTAMVLGKTDYDVLNAVTLRKMATATMVAYTCGLAVRDVEDVLARLVDEGLVAIAQGMAMPTNEAEPVLVTAASRFYTEVRQDAVIAFQFERFEVTNAQFLKALSAWQQIDIGGRKVTNDHTDAAYDERVISRLDRLIQHLRPLLEALARHDKRFVGYEQRFANAMQAIYAGDYNMVSSPASDSVHNIWFEFHEDLLRTLGRKRTE